MDSFLGLKAIWWAIIIPPAIALLVAAVKTVQWLVDFIWKVRKESENREWRALLGKALDKIPHALDPRNPPAIPAHFDKLQRELDVQLKRGVSINLLDLLKVGAVEYARDNYDRAMHYFQIALDKAEQANDKTITSAAIGNIGLVYLAKGDLDSGLQFQQKALDLDRQTGFVIGQASDLGSMGLIYLKKGANDKALQCLSESLELQKKLGNQQGQATQLASIGLVYLV